MRAILFEQFGEPAEVLNLRQVDKPEPGPGQVRVRMVASPINPSDIMVVRGRYGRLPNLPATPGFEGVGVVDAGGPGMLRVIRGLSPGKRVAVLNGTGGNWQEFVVVPAKNVVPVDDLPDAQAATFFVNPATAWIMTRNVLKVPRGEWLLQTAAGSALGQMVQRLANQYGFRVLNVVRRTEQAEQMRQAGLTAISGPEESIPEQVRKITDGRGVLYAIDAVGGATAVVAAKSLAPRGKLLLYGTLSNDPMTLDSRVLMTGQTSIEGFWLSEWIKDQGIVTMLRLFRRIRKFMKQGIFTTDVQELPLEDIQNAIRLAETPGRGKKVLLRIARE